MHKPKEARWDLVLMPRNLEVLGQSVARGGRRTIKNRLIIDSGFDRSGVRLEIFTAPAKSSHWPNCVILSPDDWKKLARHVGKILSHCGREARRQYGVK